MHGREHEHATGSSIWSKTEENVWLAEITCRSSWKDGLNWTTIGQMTTVGMISGHWSVYGDDYIGGYTAHVCGEVLLLYTWTSRPGSRRRWLSTPVYTTGWGYWITRVGHEHELMHRQLFFGRENIVHFAQQQNFSAEFDVRRPREVAPCFLLLHHFLGKIAVFLPKRTVYNVLSAWTRNRTSMKSCVTVHLT